MDDVIVVPEKINYTTKKKIAAELTDLRSRKVTVKNNYKSKCKNDFFMIGGKKWYYFFLPHKQADGRIGIMDEYTDEEIATGIVVQLTVKKTHIFSFFQTMEDFFRHEAGYLMKNRGFYETVIGCRPQKPHFDLDVDLSSNDERLATNKNQVVQDMLNYVMWAIASSFEQVGILLDFNKDVLLFSSHGEKKHSYHIIIDNYCHSNNVEAKNFYKLVLSKIPLFFHDWIDSSVYSSIQQFRLEGSQKLNSGRVKRLESVWLYGTDQIQSIWSYDLSQDFDKMAMMIGCPERAKIFAAGLIGNTYYCKILPDFSEFLPNQIKPHSILNPTNLDQYMALEAMGMLAESLDIHMDSPRFPYEFGKVSGGIITLLRKRESYCKICCRKHQNENPFLYVVGTNLDVFFNCRRDKENRSLHIGSLKTGNMSGELTESDHAISDEELNNMKPMVATVDKRGRVIKSVEEKLAESANEKTIELNDLQTLYIPEEKVDENLNEMTASSSSNQPITNINININLNVQNLTVNMVPTIKIVPTIKPTAVITIPDEPIEIPLEVIDNLEHGYITNSKGKLVNIGAKKRKEKTVLSKEDWDRAFKIEN